jgi:class 3 adenylate cyclase
MSIRLKIILIVLPLVVAALLLTGVSSYFAASNGISRVAREFLAFKSSQLRKHAESQWSLLVENGLTGRPEMVEATREAVAAYAASLATSATELTAAFSADGSVLMATGVLALASGEQEAVGSLALAKNTDYLTVGLGGVQRVGKGFWFEPFGWYVLVTEERAAFYAGVNEIWVRTLIILGVAIAAAVALVLVFAGWLTRPLKRVVASMRQIIETNDLGERVEVEYHDEIGQLAQTFNLMVDGLEGTYGHIRRRARTAGVDQRREELTLEVFQTYVARNVIEQVTRNPKAILQGEERTVVVLFSHVHGFAEISESIGDPGKLVSQLNRYFRGMVDVVTARNGIVDKYIDDAVMALFGHSEKHEDDVPQSLFTSLDMLDAAESFNREQKGNRHPEFPTSVGISYGNVTVGNIGCEQKMGYTVIGDEVNLASRAQGMCNEYHQPIIFTEGVHRKLTRYCEEEERREKNGEAAVSTVRARDLMPCRLIDTVAVKGRSKGIRLYTIGRRLTGTQKQAWNIHNAAMDEYYNKNFANAAKLFGQVQGLLPGDYVSGDMIERSRENETMDLPPDWDGVKRMTKK